MKQLETTLSAQAKMLGAEFYGVTMLENIEDHHHKIPHQLLNNYDKAISIGMVMPNSLVENMINEDYDFAIELYNHFFNEVIVPNLERTALIITNFLEKSGFKAFSLPVNLANFNQQHPEYFHHLIASYAGLGWLGKNNRLVNATYGTRINCITILTNADLEPSETVENGCKQCTLCIDKCSFGALSGVPFHPHHDINDRCNSEKCVNKPIKIEPNKRSLNLKCGICYTICPYNK
ncbi:epoxyqueuosine reductase [Clostridium sp. 'deep sea']|uniref:epoxyqueuosine reductase n=1 Tax=Clostridium sp. 'deep sea' TaxID=2779445 RepID=UPI0018968C81|nr:epoxyqueuosine reductase [Clostridium sp. 'deep sea']QOR35563.1 epoxyqueuosine reductase [Clostridium sp. 'deep sea']